MAPGSGGLDSNWTIPGKLHLKCVANMSSISAVLVVLTCAPKCRFCLRGEEDPMTSLMLL